MFVLNTKKFFASLFVLINVNITFAHSAVNDLTLPEQRVMAFRDIHLSPYESILPACHTKLKIISEGISAVPFDKNVHALDTFFGQELTNLLDIAQSLDLGKAIPLENAFVVARAIYQPQPAFLECFNNLCEKFSEQEKLLFSRVVTFAQELNNKWEIDDGIAWFATLEDNQTTNGGCLQGRRNRLFVALARTMSNVGV